MYVKELIVKNFRNYQSLNISFSPEINFIVGNNGVGKTNILEALTVVSNIKSFRNINDSEIIKWDEDSYYCSVVVEGNDERLFEVGCSRVEEKLKKRLKIDGGEIKNAAEYYGRLLTVILSPTDINIINGSPDYRRRFFDSVISKIDNSYFQTLGEFKKILASRNRILKGMKGNPSGMMELDVWDTLFSEKAAFLIHARRLFIDRFNRIFNGLYRDIASEEDSPEIRYHATCDADDPDDIYRVLHNSRNRDMYLGATGIGPQRDDYILHNSSLTRFTSYASQGQRRTAAVALKVSECVFIEEEKGSKAVILVDDIFSELDEIRRSNIIDILCRGNQIIFTMVHFDPHKLRQFGRYKGFVILTPGSIEEIAFGLEGIANRE